MVMWNIYDGTQRLNSSLFTDVADLVGDMWTNSDNWGEVTDVFHGLFTGFFKYDLINFLFCYCFSTTAGLSYLPLPPPLVNSVSYLTFSSIVSTHISTRTHMLLCFFS